MRNRKLWSPKSVFHLTDVAQRQEVVQPPSAGQSHPVRHVPSTDQPGKGVQPLADPKVDDALTPLHGAGCGAQLTCSRPRPIGGQVLAHGGSQPRCRCLGMQST